MNATRSQDAMLAWLGLAIAIVVLQNFGWGPYARYTLLAVIAYGALTHVDDLNHLFGQLVGGLTPPATQLPIRHHL